MEFHQIKTSRIKTFENNFEFEGYSKIEQMILWTNNTNQ